MKVLFVANNYFSRPVLTRVLLLNPTTSFEFVKKHFIVKLKMSWADIDKFTNDKTLGPMRKNSNLDLDLNSISNLF